MPRKTVLGGALLLLAGVWLAQDVARPPAEQLSARAGVALIRFYQQHLHSYTSRFGRCRLHPTCSRYGVEALQQKGAAGVVDIGERLYACSRKPVPPRASGARRPPTPEVAGAATPAVSLALLQRREEEEAGAACAVLALVWLLTMLVPLLFFVAFIAIWVVLMIYVVRDAKNRGMENPVLWLIVVIFAHFIGLIIYFVVRTPGNLVACENCKNKKLESLRACPHCGADDPRASAQPPSPPPAVAPTAPPQ